MTEVKKVLGISGRQVSVQVGDNVKISRTARFGPGVKIGDNVKIGPNSTIGADSVIGDGTQIGARVSLGNKARCMWITINNGATIGNEFVGCGRSSSQQVVIGGKVVINDQVKISGHIQIEDDYLGSEVGLGTQILQYGELQQIIIDTRVKIGRWCKINNTSFDSTVFIGDKAELYDSRVGAYVSIGPNSNIQKVSIGPYVRIGCNVIIRPTAHIPPNWLIPDNAIVNPQPGSTTPVVIPRTPPQN